MNPAGLDLSVVLLVLFAGALHAIWNAIAKGISDKMIGLGLMSVAFGVTGVVALPFTGLPASRAIGFAVVSAVLHVGYDLALMRAYRVGDFGHAYPLARGSAPILVAVGAWVVGGERLQLVEMLGVATVAVGLISIVFVGGWLRRPGGGATAAALLTGCTIASYSLVDGFGARRSGNILGYAALLFALEGAAMLLIAVRARWRDPAWTSARTASAGLTAGMLSLVSYGIVVWAQTRGALAVVSALRESGVITGAVIAAVVFHERFGWRRVPGAVLVVVGIVLIQV